MLVFSNRALWLDFLRAVMAIGVLHGHMCGLYAAEGYNFELLTQFNSEIRVPTFYCLSGIVCARFVGNCDFKALKGHYTTLFGRLLVPLIVFMFLSYEFVYALQSVSQGLFRGLYFLFSLFVASFLNVTLLHLLRDMGRRLYLLSFGTMVLVSLLSFALISLHLDSLPAVFKTIREVCVANVFFVFGLLTGVYWEYFARAFNRIPIVVLLFAVFCVLFYWVPRDTLAESGGYLFVKMVDLGMLFVGIIMFISGSV